jgi:hypothetical protein
MVLIFPNHESLRLALTSGAISPSISRTAALAALDEQGRLIVQPTVTIPRAKLGELQRLGIESTKSASLPLAEQVFCWPQLLPIRAGERSVARPDQTPVLFDLPVEQLGNVATEILRLGNNRQSFRTLEKDGAPSRVLLRVIGPPYYTLLRALDRADANGDSPVAYIECAPRVWVQFGHVHPLGENFKPSAGKMLLMRPPRQWTFLDEQPFHDICSVLDFELPDAPVEWSEAELRAHLRVPLRLAHGGGNEAAELWVIRDDPMAQLDAFVQSASDTVLARLAFAVGTLDGRSVVVLRVRPSKQQPPVLMLDAIAYRTYLKLPNLFLPCGQHLQPPLRRDAVRQRLADDPAIVTWLHPHGDGKFTAESMPDTAFHPLAEWVDYVLDQERRPLDAWVQSTQFDFESFVCDDEQSAKPKTPAAPDRRRSAGIPPAKTATHVTQPAAPTTPTAESIRDEDELMASHARTEPSEVRKQLDALEAKFLAVSGPLDASERQALWPALAELNATLANDDAAACWLHALWIADAPQSWAGRWLKTEARLVAQHGTAMARKPVTLVPVGGGEENSPELNRLLAAADPTMAEVRELAALLLWTARHTSRGARSVGGGPFPANASGSARLNAVRQFLEQHDHTLPVRAAWLAWTSVVTLAGNDVLTLARARDRLLERLFQNGLRPEQELPSFLRFGGQALGQRLRAIRQWMLELRELVGKCCERMDNWRLYKTDHGTTPACLDLIFAFGLARLGESTAAAELQDRAAKQLAVEDAFYQFMLRAYTFRIRQANEGKLPTRSLPDAMLAYLELKEPSERHSFDRLRELSRIVEPSQRIRWDKDYVPREDQLGRKLARLPEILALGPLAADCRRLLAEHASEPQQRARVIGAVLEQAPRLGEDFAVGIINQAIAAFDALPPLRADKGLSLGADLLEKALFVAAHFDRAEQVQALLTRFHKLLRSQADAEKPQLFTALAGQCLRGLRKLGMRQEIELLLRQLEDLVLKGRKPEALTAEDAGKHGETLLALLHLAAGWYDFGKDHEAELVINLTRTVLFAGPLPAGTNPAERGNLACTYAATLGHAPLELAQKRMVELFTKLESVATSWYTTPGYCALQLKLAEAVVLAIVSDDFTQGSQMRRWLDEDEFLVRKRIHEDMRALMAQSA